MSPSDKQRGDLISEEIVKMIFNQIKESIDQNSDHSENLSKNINELLKILGNNPKESLDILRKHSDEFKDFVRYIGEKPDITIKNLSNQEEILKEEISKCLNTNTNKIINIEEISKEIKEILKTINKKFFILFTIVSISYGLFLTFLGILAKFFNITP